MSDAGTALRAGLDVGISYETGYMKAMTESVAEGKASMADIDRAVGRILRQLSSAMPSSIFAAI